MNHFAVTLALLKRREVRSFCAYFLVLDQHLKKLLKNYFLTFCKALGRLKRDYVNKIYNKPKSQFDNSYR